MKLLEHEAKDILTRAGVPVPMSTLITPNADISSINVPVVIKSQVPVGGRGKAGGVQIVSQKKALSRVVETLFSLSIQGHLPSALLAEERIDGIRELYLSFFIDRDEECIRLLVHKSGGINVENHRQEEFLSIPIPEKITASIVKQVASCLELSPALVTPLLRNLLRVFIANDALLLEINPLIYTAQDALICGDCKMELDDAAAFRHPEWRSPVADTNFVTLNKHGTIGTIANGAGLAMATVDAVAAAGMIPANFLDIGGGANTESVLRALRRMSDFNDLQAIVINIFAGITRCDEVAKAIIAAKQQISHLPPLYIRLAGTNFEEAVVLLSSAKITTLATLEECLQAAKEAS